MKSAILFLLTVATAAGSAAEVDLACGPADNDAVTVDGITDDWSDVTGLDAGGQDPNASFTIKCSVIGDRTLALLIDVRDNYFVRTAKALPGEDHLEVTLGGKRLLLYPGDAAKIKDKVVWGAPGKVDKSVRVASALQPHGWAVELELPLAQVPGWKPGSPSISLQARMLDCDSKAALETERTVSLFGASGRIVFAQADQALEAFLQDRGLSRAQVFWDEAMALGRKSGARAVLAGHFLAVLSDGFLFIELPFRERKDLKEVRLIDLAGDGRDAVVMRYAERGGGGARDVVAVYRPVGDAQVQRVFACEVGKSIGGGRIDSRLSFVKRGKATDIVVESGAAHGVSATSWHESPAEDMVPILLPWGDERRARYQFSGDEYRRAQ